jgi:hypothetical protein
MKVLKFMALLVGMYVVGIYIPYGSLINIGVVGVGLWKLI